MQFEERNIFSLSLNFLMEEWNKDSYSMLDTIHRIRDSVVHKNDRFFSSWRALLRGRKINKQINPSSRGSSQSRNQTQVSCIAGGFFTSSPTREAQINQIDTMITNYNKYDDLHDISESNWLGDRPY